MNYVLYRGTKVHNMRMKESRISNNKAYDFFLKILFNEHDQDCYMLLFFSPSIYFSNVNFSKCISFSNFVNVFVKDFCFEKVVPVKIKK